MPLEKLIANIEVRKLFLIDGLGAILSAVLLGFVLTSNEVYIGMPVHILHFLAFAALVLATYSLSCYLFVEKRWRILLQVIAVANLLYCVVTIGLVIYSIESVTSLGIIYFIGEIAIVTTLAIVEWTKAINSL